MTGMFVSIQHYPKTPKILQNLSRQGHGSEETHVKRGFTKKLIIYRDPISILRMTKTT